MGGGGGVEAGMDGCGNNSNITIVSSKGVSIGAGGVEAEVLQDLWRKGSIDSIECPITQFSVKLHKR